MSRQHDEHVERAALALRARLDDPSPEIFLTLGSGLAAVAEALEDPVEVPVAAVPGLPVSRVPGHPATLRYGRLSGREVLVQLGRVHLYEGHTPGEVVRLVDVAALLGCGAYVVTNAAGGLRPDSQSAGDLAVITDHLNLTGTSPLVGVLRDGAPVFVNMASAYDAELRAVALDVAADQQVPIHEGVYAGLLGPAYETPAEVHMLRTLGADLVGMSTVIEVIAARANGMQVLGLSAITNVHRGGQATTHDEVLDVGSHTAARLAQVVLGVLERW